MTINYLLDVLDFSKSKRGSTVEFGNEIYITDPCYSIDTWCQHKQEIKPGKYHCFLRTEDKYLWGERVAEIIAVHENYLNDFPNNTSTERMISNKIGVDSGQAGFFDAEAYTKWKSDKAEDDVFYDTCGWHTLSEHQAGTVLNKGYVSSSGYGDGCYCAYGHFNQENECVAVSIKFLEFEEDDDEEDNE